MSQVSQDISGVLTTANLRVLLTKLAGAQGPHTSMRGERENSDDEVRHNWVLPPGHEDSKALAVTTATPPPRRFVPRFSAVQPKRPSLPKKKLPGRNKSRGGWRDITAGDAASYGYAAYKMAKQIISLINVEQKFFDVDGSGGVTVTDTPSVINLSNIAQGTDFYQRVGNSVRPQNFEVRMILRGNSATAGNQCRILIVQDKESQGTDPTLGLVLAAGTYPILQPHNPLYKQRFKYLYDEIVNLTNPSVGLASSGTSTDYIPARIVLPMLKMHLGGHIRFDATAGADASDLEGQLFLMAVSLDATNGPNLSYTSRLEFTDD